MFMSFVMNFLQFNDLKSYDSNFIIQCIFSLKLWEMIIVWITKIFKFKVHV